MTVLCGDDDPAIAARRRELLDAATDGTGAGIEHNDVGADGGAGLVEAVASRSMFGPRRVIAAEGLDLIEVRHLDELVAAAEHSDACVVARCTKAPAPKVRNKLKKVATVTTLSVPKGKGVAIAIAGLAEAAGIVLDRAGRELLISRVGDDGARARSIIAQLRLAGLTRPTVAQLDQLAGSTAGQVAPWDVTDALEAGDAAAAIRAAGGLEAVAVVAFCGSRTGQFGRLIDSGVRGEAEAAELLGIHKFPASKAVKVAGRLDAEAIRVSWDAVAAADRATKRHRHPDAVVDQLLITLAATWGPRRR